MARKGIEEHLAEFLLTQKGEELRDYRKRCIQLWREHYGDAVAERVKKIVRERVGNGKR